MAWTRQTQDQINDLFARQRAADPFGLRLHLFFAAAYLFFAAWPTTYVDWAGLCLMVCFAVRMLTHHRIMGPLVWDPVTRLTLAWVAWIVLSGFWSYGTWADWAADAGSIRYASAVALLYPVLDRRGLLIAALVAGFACAELSQLAHAISVWAGHAGALFNRDPARLSGWWDPVAGGSMLCGGLGVVCGLAMSPDAWPGLGARGRRGLRTVAMVMIPTTLLAIVATGTRGAWIGAAALVPVAVLVGVLAGRGGLSPRARLRIAVVGLVTIGLAIQVVALTPGLRNRVESGYREVTSALERRDYSSDTGMRLAMWVWAERAFVQNPVIGVGAGGYRTFAKEYVASHAATDARPLPLPHAHAHSWYMHTLATLGLVGAGLMTALALTATLRRRRGDEAGFRPPHPAVMLGLAGLAFAGLFDTIHVNQQTANLLFILLALAVKLRPAAGPESASHVDGARA